MGRQPEALRRGERRGGEESEEERLEGNSEGRGAKGAEKQRGIERKVKRE